MHDRLHNAAWHRWASLKTNVNLAHRLNGVRSNRLWRTNKNKMTNLWPCCCVICRHAAVDFSCTAVCFLFPCVQWAPSSTDTSPFVPWAPSSIAVSPFEQWAPSTVVSPFVQWAPSSTAVSPFVQWAPSSTAVSTFSTVGTIFHSCQYICTVCPTSCEGLATSHPLNKWLMKH